MTTRILIDNSIDGGASCFLFEEPCGEVLACRPDEVDDAIAALTAAAEQGLWAAGFFSYELGYLLEPRLQPLLPKKQSVPLLRFALFKERKTVSGAQAEAVLEAWRSGDYTLSDPVLTMDRATYRERFGRTKDYISAGDIYQLNLTLKGTFQTEGCPVALYADLRRTQPVAYGAYMEFDDLTVLSLSPELFLTTENGTALTRPMKGTAARAMTPDHDEAARRWLETDEKSRAENLMIVDLMRNDLGRVAKTGSVLVTDLFTVETYRTLHQMTSGISARLKTDTDLAAILHSLFPPGSITGAPKVRAMEIIAELESGARGIYTGALGMLGPGGQIHLNVAIRTLTLQDDGQGEIGIGSGLVDDSVADAEYEECLLKMRFLTEKP
ncbi:MAG: aminodeoxychorismate synthase component I, partial [Hyphomicrobiales bacterium]|nr:aminodeoxychorismate synthase component I [Hyphomicrobiales bacterium]